MIRHRRIFLLVTLLLMLSLVLAACGPKATPTTPPQPTPIGKLKVAFVYVAPIGDMGWTWAHEQGRLAVEKQFGDKVETAYIENVPEGPDAERVIRDFAQKGYNLIITTSFGFMDPTVTVAKEFPKTWFVHVSGYKTEVNSSTIFGKIEEPRYVSGMIAGKMTTSNKLGYVAAFPIPEVIRGINAFTLGVRKVNPAATVTVVWTSTWFDPVKEKEAAVALLDQGCDVIAQHQDTAEPQKAAEERGKYGVGYDADMSPLAPKAVLTSPIWNWGIKYVDIVQRVMNGTYKTEEYWGGWKDGVVDMAPIGPMVPADVKAMAEAEVAKFKSGSQDIFTIFTGPINGQNGQLAVAPGQTLTAGDLLSDMTWFVEGVVGEAPGKPPVAIAKTVKAAFVYVAPIGDLGWTWAHDEGRLMVEKELGVETVYIENVPEGPDAERVIRDFAQKGYDIIFTTSFGFMDPTLTVAGEFPNKYFEHCSGYKTAANLSTYFGRMYQPRFLSGLVAGKATKSNKIGYVAAYPIPEVIRGINAFTLGVRAANPAATVHVVWTSTWFDPVKEKEAAVALLDAGCDVIAQHQDTTEPQKAAAERGAVSIGYDSDMRQFVGDSVLTSPVWHWGPYYVARVKAAMEGTWTTGQYWGSMKDGITGLAPFSPRVSADVVALVKQWETKILNGEWDVFYGPINSQDGKLAIAQGQKMADGDMLSMDWFVQGVVGEAPGKAPVAAQPDELKVAFVYVGPQMDLGWSYAHDQGRQYLEKNVANVTTTFSELVNEGPDSTRIIRDYAQKGYDIIFATSFGYMDSVIEVAKEFPKVVFEHCTGYLMAENAGIYDGRGYQGWYLAGIVAGKMTKTGKLGYIAPYPIPEVVRNMNAFALGARSVNPNATVKPVWIFTWVDPVKEREAAVALADAGCDVIARESDSTEPDKLAQERGVYAIGYNTYLPDVAPKALLTAPVWNWGLVYKQIAEEVRAGTWKSGAIWWGMKEGLLSMAPYGSMVPADVRALADAKKAQILAGTFDVFVGPIKDNTGKERVAAGVTMSDPDKLSFDWLVEGVDGTIPN